MLGARRVVDPEPPPNTHASNVTMRFLRSLSTTSRHSGNFGQALAHNVAIGTFEKLERARNRCRRKVLRASPLRCTHCRSGGRGSTGGGSRLSELQQCMAEAPGDCGEGVSR
ncbi:hypothetical protein MTO96_034416 [Rhipicephalus appendiculatus]